MFDVGERLSAGAAAAADVRESEGSWSGLPHSVCELWAAYGMAAQLLHKHKMQLLPFSEDGEREIYKCDFVDGHEMKWAWAVEFNVSQ